MYLIILTLYGVSGSLSVSIDSNGVICNGRFPVSANTVWLGVFGEIPQSALVMKLDLGSAIKSDEPQIAKKNQESFHY